MIRIMAVLTINNQRNCKNNTTSSRGVKLLYVAFTAELAVLLFCDEVGGVVGVETVATAAAYFAVEEANSFGIRRGVLEFASLAGNYGVPHADGVV